MFRKTDPFRWMLSVIIIACLGLLLGCGSGGLGEIAATGGTGTGTTTSSTGSISLSINSALPPSSTNTTNTVTFGTPVYGSATIKDANGATVPNVVVTFATASEIVVFTPTLATALTNASGTASIQMDAATITAAGATSITASAQITSGGTTTTLTSTPVGIAVNGATVTLGAITLGKSSISAYGSSSVTVPVLIDGAPAMTPIAVTFTSSCAADNKATLTSPVTSVAGTATSTYTDDSCARGSDTITASVTGASVNKTITVAIPAPNNIQFVSATPAVIGTLGTGAATLPQSSLVKFKVVDNNNNPKNGVDVDFSLLPSSSPGGIVLSPTSATSNGSGEVTTNVTAGTVPTPVWVVAKLHDNPAILSQSNTLTITTGLPTQDFFSLSVQTFNIEGWNYDGVTSALTVIASDRLGNPVPDGTAINFITEGSQIVPASCTITNGTCTVTFKSSELRPADGRVTILAYAVGEKSFVDLDGDNVYDSGETFYDIGDLFIDSNENEKWDAGEQYIQYAATSGTNACTAQVGNYWNVPSKVNSCDGIWGNSYVRRSQVIVLSGSSPTISAGTFNMGGQCAKTFIFSLTDEHNNPMPAGTTVGINHNLVYYTKQDDTSSTKATISTGGTPVVNTNHLGGTEAIITIEGQDCDVGKEPAGTVEIVITTPKGLVTSIPVTVN